MLMRLILLALLASLATGMRVLVTGAGGRTGQLVFKQLNDNGKDAVGLVRSKKANKVLKKAGAKAEQIIRADTTVEDEVRAAMEGCDAVVLCTSAVPAIKPLSLVKFMFKKTILRSKNPGRMQFKFAEGGTPQEVDWLGAKMQIDCAKEAGIKKFVFISSMGGTQPDNFLNSIGKQPDGSGGDILLWKRKAERYLLESGMDYTIIHPGGLVDEPPCERELLPGVDDELLGLTNRQVPRADVARVACAALADPKAAKLSMDLASKAVGEGEPTLDASAVFAALNGKSCKYDMAAADPPAIPSLR